MCCYDNLRHAQVQYSYLENSLKLRLIAQTCNLNENSQKEDNFLKI